MIGLQDILKLTTRRTLKNRLIASRYNIKLAIIASSTLCRFMICCVSYRTKPENRRTEKHATPRSRLALKGRTMWTSEAVRRPIRPAKRKGAKELKSY